MNALLSFSHSASVCACGTMRKVTVVVVVAEAIPCSAVRVSANKCVFNWTYSTTTTTTEHFTIQVWSTFNCGPVSVGIGKVWPMLSEFRLALCEVCAWQPVHSQSLDWVCEWEKVRDLSWVGLKMNRELIASFSCLLQVIAFLQWALIGANKSTMLNIFLALETMRMMKK